jgi:hypothetical protein
VAKVLRTLLIGLLILVMAGFTTWGVLALYHRLPLDETARQAVAAFFALAGAILVLCQFGRWRVKAFALFIVLLAPVLLWWSAIDPPTTGNWSPDVARQVTGKIEGNTLTLTGVRNFRWEAAGTFTENWDTRQYNLAELESLDLFMSYWAGPEMAHLILSFGFENGDQLAWSIEVRRQVGEEFSPLADAFKEHTLVIIAADERDVIGTRTNVRGEDVQLYRLSTTPGEARALLEQYVAASNLLAEQPHFYNSLTTNCSSVVFILIRELAGQLPLDWRMVVNGYLPDYIYERGALDTRVPMQELREKGRITVRAQKNGISPVYSRMIRQGVPSPLQ